MAEILQDLHADSVTIAAAILYGCALYADLSAEDITENTNPSVAKLIFSTAKLANISELHKIAITRETSQQNLDNIRKMLLAMVDDIRIVLIKLAEQLYILRKAATFNEQKKQQIANEIIAIYAPLANRLGMVHMKWELEDLSFRYLEPEKYNAISAALKQTKLERDQSIQNTIKALKEVLEEFGVTDFQISGRAKHIYSIYRKMSRKKVDITNIYDASAFRILVPTIEDCYKALSAVHSTWQQITKEFDDYIANPKPNGYRSIHTAVIGPQGKNVEIQIRTQAMHEQAELGMAAHWIYKEGGGTVKPSYEAKIAWLRQIMDWQNEISANENTLKEIKHIFSDRVYVFTPQGDVLDLPNEATPLDFAYHIHSEIGNRCVGAKVNGNIVPLTYKLKTGEYIEILTAKNGTPSRDWLSSSLGFLKSARSKAKVLNWFRKKELERHVIQGQELLDKELKRSGIKQINFDVLLKSHPQYKSKNELLAALGSGELKAGSVISAATTTKEKPQIIEPLIHLAKPIKHSSNVGDFAVQGIDNLLINVANCCRPVPGEKIVGYITRGHGLSIHRENCPNMLYASKSRPERLIFVNWGKNTTQRYPTKIRIQCFDRSGLIRDISNVIADEGLTIASLTVNTNKKENIAIIDIIIEIASLEFLNKVLNKISHIANVFEAKKIQ
jgi:GTP pyrophosphokinase